MANVSDSEQEVKLEGERSVWNGWMLSFWNCLGPKHVPQLNKFTLSMITITAI